MRQKVKEGIDTVASPDQVALPGAIRGVLVGINDSGMPLVDHCSNPKGESLPAISTVMVSDKDVGKEVILLFEDADLRRPIIIGVVQAPLISVSDRTDLPTINAVIDGSRIVLSAKNEIVLKCGVSSITLTRGGKILIRGEYVSTQASGVNRIKGGSVQIN